MKILHHQPKIQGRHQHAPSLTRRALFSTLISGAFLARHTFAENAQDRAERFRQMSADFERKGLTPVPPEQSLGGAQERALLRLFSHLPVEERARLISLAREIAGRKAERG